MEPIEMRISEEGMQPLILQAARQYKRPLHALREYVTNALDAYADTNSLALVNVFLDPRAREFMVTDAAGGMNEERMRALPVNVGNSIRRGRIDTRGEKAVGLVAFGSTGSQLDLVSRVQGENGYNHLRYAIVGEGMDEIVTAEFERLSEREVEAKYKGGFRNGTKAIVRVTPEIFDRQFKPTNVRKFLQQTYMPLLVPGNGTAFYVGQAGKETPLDMPPIKGDGLMNLTLPFTVNRKNSSTDHAVKVNLRFNPEASDGRIGLYSKGVLVYDSVTQMDDRLAEMPLWKCRQVSGFVNEPMLSLTLGRDGINQNSKDYKALFEVLERVNDQLAPELEQRLDKVSIHKANAYLKRAWSILSSTIAEVYDPFERSPETDTGPDTEMGETEEKKKRKGLGRKRRRKVGFNGIVIKDFGLSQRSQRSGLDDFVGKPTLMVNSSHRDYREGVIDGSPAQALQYFIDISSDPVALFQTEQLVQQNKLPNDERAIAAEIARRAQSIRIDATKRLKGDRR